MRANTSFADIADRGIPMVLVAENDGIAMRLYVVQVAGRSGEEKGTMRMRT